LLTSLRKRRWQLKKKYIDTKNARIIFRAFLV